MSQETLSPQNQALWRETARYLRHTEGIRNALKWAHQNPMELEKRLEEFDVVLATLNYHYPENLDPNRYAGVIAFRNHAGGATLPSLSDLFLKGKKGRNDDVAKQYESQGPLYPTIQYSFEQIASLIKERNWQFPHQLTDNPNLLISALLIEGYGVFVEKYLKKEDLARTFVIAFEEILYSFHQEGSTLYPDIRFSPTIAQELNNPPDVQSL